MINARRDGFLLFLVGGLCFVLLGAALARVSSSSLIDFKVVYYSGRCLLDHGDPYNQADVLRAYMKEPGQKPFAADRDRRVVTEYMYLPTVFSVTIPFAALGFKTAHLLWMTLVVGGLIFASYLILDLGSEYAPAVSGALICLILANTELLFVIGNASGIAVSCAIIAVWCFFKERLEWLGVVCLAVSLALKPHDTGLVWLYFLLAGGTYRKRALQTLAVLIAISLPALIWLNHVAPHWMAELHSHISAFSRHGDLNDPGPASSGAHGIGMMINLQTALSLFHDTPAFYNSATYSIFAALMIAWIVITLRARITPANTWLGLAAISALSMLPVYHRQCDATLLLLAIPAAAMFWAARKPPARLALGITVAVLVAIGDLTWVIVLGLIYSLHPTVTGLRAEMLIALQVLPAPLSLLMAAVFYLWAYARSVFKLESPQMRNQAG